MPERSPSHAVVGGRGDAGTGIHDSSMEWIPEGFAWHQQTDWSIDADYNALIMASAGRWASEVMSGVRGEGLLMHDAYVVFVPQQGLDAHCTTRLGCALLTRPLI